MPKETYSRPSDVVAAGGQVLVDGPSDFHFFFTPEAAAETGARLIDQAAIAARQRAGPEPDRD